MDVEKMEKITYAFLIKW